MAKKMQMSNILEEEMQSKINQAEGKAEEILTISKATAEFIMKVGADLSQ